jgi:hypothetical protein
MQVEWQFKGQPCPKVQVFRGNRMSYLPHHWAGVHQKSAGGEGIRQALETHCFRPADPTTGLRYLPTTSANTLSQTYGFVSGCSLVRF